MTIRAVVWGVALGVVLSAIGMEAQKKGCVYQDENGKTVNSPDCTVPPDPQPATQPGAPASSTAAPSAAKQFPFPGEPASGTPPDGSGTSATPAAKPDQPAATKRFPFPGEPAEGGSADGGGQKPVAPAGGGLQDAGSSGSSSDAGSSSSSSAEHNDPTAGPLGDEDDDAAAKAVAARKNRKKLPPIARQTPTEQEQEDLNVGQFYQEQGNYKAAYLRATDAVSLVADDPDAHFALAEAARRLGKLDEAEAHYKKCLTLDPIPKEKKAAETALKQMAGR